MVSCHSRLSSTVLFPQTGIPSTKPLLTLTLQPRTVELVALGCARGTQAAHTTAQEGRLPRIQYPANPRTRVWSLRTKKICPRSPSLHGRSLATAGLSENLGCVAFQLNADAMLPQDVRIELVQQHQPASAMATGRSPAINSSA